MNEKTLSWSLIFVLAMVTFWTFLPVAQNDFIAFDDPDYVTANAWVQQGLSRDSVYWAFRSTEYSNWFPLTWLSHMLDYELFGAEPRGHHLTSAGIHVINALLLFILLLQLTGRHWPAFFVALFFAVHPLRVESVAWVSERKDVLSALFFFLTLLAYRKYVHRHCSRHWLLITLGLFALGLMSKPMLVTLPCILLLLDFWPLRRFDGLQAPGDRNPGSALKLIFWRSNLALIKEKYAFFGLSAASAGITLYAQARGASVAAVQHLPWMLRLANAIVAYGTYIFKTFCPQRLAIFYPHPGTDISLGLAVAIFAGLAAITVLCVIHIRPRPYLLVGWLWYLGMLVPVIGLIQVGEQALADRYTYLPLIGLLLMICWLIADLIPANAQMRRLAILAVSALAVALVPLTRRQVAFWRNNFTLFTQAQKVTERNYIAENNLGSVWLQRNQPQKAIWHYRRALLINPEHAAARNNLGYAYLVQDNLGLALREFHTALQLNPRENLSRANLNYVLHELQAAAERQPVSARDHNAQALFFLRHGQLEAAEKSFRAALALHPYYMDALYHLAHLLLQQQRMQEAIPLLEKALTVDPRNDRVAALLAELKMKQTT